MKKQVSVGFIPYEIGDVIQLKNNATDQFVIDDIIFTQSVKNKTSKFEVELKLPGSDWTGKVDAELISNRVIKNQQ